MSATLATDRVVTLGGPGTFAGQATRAFVDQMPELGPIDYLSTMDGIWSAIASGEVDSGVLTGETTNTGLQEIAEQLLRAPVDLFVNGEILVPYRCMLLGKPGTEIDDIRLVLGHGSLMHCRGYLAEHLPHAQVRMHEQNSLAAAAEVLAGNGDIAVVGTELSAQRNGLAVLQADVDRGAVGAWWIMSRQLRVGEHADTVVVAVRCAEGGRLDEVTAQLSGSGLAVRSIAAMPVGQVFRYDHLVVFTGDVPTDALRSDLDVIAGCRLVGAFTSLSAARP